MKFIRKMQTGRDILGSTRVVLLFETLEYHFKKKPEGFYKFQAPCKSNFYRKGNSLSEELGVTARTIQTAMKKICCSYKSKTIYKTAIKELGELGVFQGKPYLSYYDLHTNRTFYLRDYRVVNQIKSGTYRKE